VIPDRCRQVGGALAVAVFGALLAGRASFLHGVRASLLIAAVVALGAAAASLLLMPTAIDDRRKDEGDGTGQGAVRRAEAVRGFLARAGGFYR
jgi:sugar phosphate permease